ncbi:hypothetical protein [Haloprofundus halobius]|uniref:hypothetical protein n=1 Tax=Haloprofundus halobius TaxID=2876194 RepID=UPI001CCCB202|nr:hypothetical protein [Haloprofundus halobius]
MDQDDQPPQIEPILQAQSELQTAWVHTIIISLALTVYLIIKKISEIIEYTYFTISHSWETDPVIYITLIIIGFAILNIASHYLRIITLRRDANGNTVQHLNGIIERFVTTFSRFEYHIAGIMFLIGMIIIALSTIQIILLYFY